MLEVGRFAVLDGADSRRWVAAPADRETAIELRDRHAGRFWCARAAGGCGTNLSLKAGERNRPYFAHHEGLGLDCPLRHDPGAWERSYLHLALQDCLRRWLVRQGRTGTLEAPLPGGGRADLLVVKVDESDQSIEVQLSPIDVDTWTKRTDRYLTSVNRVSWVFGPKAGQAMTAHVAQQHGYALHVQLRDQLLEAEFDPGDPTMVEIGTQVPAQGSSRGRADPAMTWLSLADCTFTNQFGITTPQVAAAAEAHARRQAVAEALAELRAGLGSGRSGGQSTASGATPGSVQPLPGTGPTQAARAQPAATPLPSKRRGTGRGPVAAHGWLEIVDTDGNVDYEHPTAIDLARRVAAAAPDVVELWKHLHARIRDATVVMSYIVTRVEAGGPTWRLGFPDVEDDDAIETILRATGLIHTYTGHRDVLRWKRP